MALSDNRAKIQELIDAINAQPGGGSGDGGGGLPAGISALASGTFTPSSDIAGDYSVVHGLGVTPNFYILVVEDDFSLVPNDFYVASEACIMKNVVASGDNNLIRGQLFMHAVNFEAAGLTLYGNSNATSNEIVFAAHAYGKLKRGATYRWVCGVMDGIE